MAAPGYAVPFTDVALAAATAKTVVGVLPSKVLTVVEVALSFDGTSATATPVLIEFCRGDGTTAGTTTSVTPLRTRGRNVAAGATAFKNATAEPTVLTVLRAWRVPPSAGFILQYPLGREPEADSSVDKLYCVRVTAAATVNATGALEFEE